MKLFVTSLLVGALVIPVFLQASVSSAATPVTSPVTYFGLSGKVTFKFFNKLQTVVTPAANVTISIKGQGSAVTLKTDAKGEFMEKVVPGTYTVKVINTKYVFSPSSQVVTVSTQSAQNINFQAGK